MAELSGRRRFAHLYRRAGFGATPAQIDQAMALSPNEDTAFTLAVDALLGYANVAENPDGIIVDPESRDTLTRWWLDRMMRTSRPLLEKMTLFWHDHFATSVDKDGMDVPKMQRQNTLFRTMGMGPFEPFLNAVSRDPAMMIWLDLTSNRRNSPNENYAREVMELFTLGVGTPSQPNYTENNETLRFLELFRSPYFADISANQWLGVLPPELVKAHLNINSKATAALPKGKPVIVK